MKNCLLLNKNRFRYTEVIEPGEDYSSFAHEIDKLISNGSIRPVKRSGRVSFAPFFWNEYFINRNPSKHAKVPPAEINQLAPSLLEYYADHPDHYMEDQNELCMLSEWMLRRDDKVECSVKERSYEIFRREKTLEGETCRRIMSRCRITYTDLGCYRTFEPFFCRKISDTGSMLILENKDPWYSIAKAFESTDTKTFFDRKIMYLVYGEGRKANSQEAGSRITDFVLSLEPQPEEVFYCGDIDRAGVAILTKCQEVNPQLNIQPFMPLYEAMAARAPKRWSENETADDSRTKRYDARFAEFFRNPQYITEVLNDNLRIPQEILSLKDYIAGCG